LALSEQPSDPADVEEAAVPDSSDAIPSTASAVADVFLSIFVHRERVGCAAFNFSDSRMSLVEDLPIEAKEAAVIRSKQNNDDEEDPDHTSDRDYGEVLQAKSQASGIISSSEFVHARQVHMYAN
jgi:hypothetical protein